MEGIKDSGRIVPTGTIYETDRTKGKSVTLKCFHMMVFPRTALQRVMKIIEERINYVGSPEVCVRPEK